MCPLEPLGLSAVCPVGVKAPRIPLNPQKCRVEAQEPHRHRAEGGLRLPKTAPTLLSLSCAAPGDIREEGRAVGFRLMDSLGFLPCSLGALLKARSSVPCPAPVVLCPGNRCDNPWHFVGWGIAAGVGKSPNVPWEKKQPVGSLCGHRVVFSPTPEQLMRIFRNVTAP